MKRKRRSAEAGEFQDPLKNYSPPAYEDEMERALCENRVDQMRTKPSMAVEASTTVRDTLKQMYDMNIASVIVTEDGRLVGILSERDVLNKVVDRYDQISDQPVREVMTVHPTAVYDTDTPAKAINLMAVGGFRHIPILDVDDQIVGVLGPRRVADYLRQHIPTES